MARRQCCITFHQNQLSCHNDIAQYEKCENFHCETTEKREIIALIFSVVILLIIPPERMVAAMKRNAIQDLINWKNDEERKPLVLKGARQVGKTWLMKEFGKNYYKSFVISTSTKRTN